MLKKWWISIIENWKSMEKCMESNWKSMDLDQIKRLRFSYGSP